jgi:glycosyltransferase involved in cell wall biosynthesis
MNSFSSGQRGQRARTDPLSVFLLARSLTTGGAEQQLVALAKSLSARGHRVSIGVFYAGGPLECGLEGSGVEIVDLAKSGRWDVVPFMLRTAAALRRRNPDLVYSFLGGGNLVAAVARRCVPRAKLVWSVRNSEFDISVDHWVARVGHRLEGALAEVPDAIIANSSAGRDFAVSRGFPAERITVVPNGIDTDRFRPDAALRAEVRSKLGLSEDAIAIGVLGRLNATKDHASFLRAAKVVSGAVTRARFLCAGSGPELERLQQLARELGIAERVIFTGELDGAAALNAFDIACSPSLTEGFSNAIAEAMSCGLPCIVTDVGDSAAIVGDCGTVVPPGSPEALAAAIRAEIANPDGHDPAESRRRIVDNFSIGTMVDRTLDVFRSVLSPTRASPHSAAPPIP